MAADRVDAAAGPRERPLASVRVLDLTGEFGAYAGRLLADLGADVIRIIPPSGDPLASHPPLVVGPSGPASAFDWFVNIGKTVVELDLRADDPGSTADELLSSADVLLESWGSADGPRADWTRDTIGARFPDLILVSITPYGLEGPRGSDVGTDLTVLASGGLLSLGGYPDTAPIAPNGGQAVFAASIFGAVAAIFALIARQADGRGRRLDVSAEEAVAAALEDAIPQFDLTGQVRSRAGERPREAGTGIYACADGYVSMVAGRLGTAKAWRSLVGWLVDEGAEGAATLLEDEWQSFPFRQRAEAITTFSEIFGRFTRTRTKEALYLDAQARSIALAPINEIPDVLANAQLRARGFFAPLSVPGLGRELGVPGRPYRYSEDRPFAPELARPIGPDVQEQDATETGIARADVATIGERRSP